MLLFLLLNFCFANVIANVIFEDCGSVYDLYTVDIDGCGFALPCYVTLGENVSVSLAFRANFESSKLDQNVIININEVNLKTDVTPELCDRVQCPVRTDGLSSFTSVMMVPRNMVTNQRGFLRWRIYNESGVMLLCYSVLVQTQTSYQKHLRTLNSTLNK